MDNINLELEGLTADVAAVAADSDGVNTTLG